MSILRTLRVVNLCIGLAISWAALAQTLDVSRTAFDDGLGGAPRTHDANFLTFHRFGDFRAMAKLKLRTSNETAATPFGVETGQGRRPYPG